MSLIGRSHINPATTQMDTDMWTFRQSLYKQIKQLSQVGLFSFPWPLPSPPTQETNYWCRWFWPATPGQESTRCESRDRTHKSYLYLIRGALAWQLEHTLNLWNAKVMKWFTCSLRWDLWGRLTNQKFKKDAQCFPIKFIKCTVCDNVKGSSSSTRIIITTTNNNSHNNIVKSSYLAFLHLTLS